MLYVVATPIGNIDDISLRAIKVFQAADVIIGEERKEVSKMLRALDIKGKQYELLNEHSRPEELGEFVEICKISEVALVSDCGTPAFCDPGADLVAACRKAGVKVTTLPGPSSLMALLSACGRRTDQFLFRGFLPAKTELREIELKKLKKSEYPIVLMDTPYRLNRTLNDLITHFPKQKCWLGLNLTQNDEQVLSGTAKELANKLGKRKAEFILLLEAL